MIMIIISNAIIAFVYKLFMDKVEKQGQNISPIFERIFLCLFVGIYVILKVIIMANPVLIFLLRSIVIFIYIKKFYQTEILWTLCLTFFLHCIVDVIFTVSGIIAGVIGYTFKMDIDSLILEVMVIVFVSLVSGLILFYYDKIFSGFSKNIRKSAQYGIILLASLIRFIWLDVLVSESTAESVLIMKMIFMVLFVAVSVLIIWLFDKHEDQKKMRELTSYAHKTREVIPSMGRALEKVSKLSKNIDEASALVDELLSICQTDGVQTRKEVQVLKSFETTGSLVLDEQLYGYLEEAVEYDFDLDIMVMSSIEDLIKTKYIERYQLLQVVGDLYRNAFKVVTKRKLGRILICLGYNRNGEYEISVHDNGQPFPQYVLDNLGKRGVTTDGTGHGMADILTAIKSSNASFVLDQALVNDRIFTKGIKIIFDQEGRLDILK